MNDANSIERSEQEEIRLQKLEALEADGSSPFHIRKAEQGIHSKDILENFDSLEGKTVTLAGRLMSKRGMGKVSFSDLQDRCGTIQIFSRIDVMGEAPYKKWLALDIGDLVSLKGEVFRTQRGEISVRNQEFTLLSKALRPLPEKFHGLQDTDTRYRKRYLDLIVNPEVRESFIMRSKIIATIRAFLAERDFIEVETPLLNVIAGGATARPFVTHHNALDLDLYLRISPELYLKRLIIGGLERVYELGRNFRNEGISIRHNPEFTMMELYQAYTDYRGMMEITEAMIYRCCQAVCESSEVEWMGRKIELKPPFCRLSMHDAIQQFAGVDFDEIHTDEEAYEAAKKAGLEDLKPGMKRGDIMNLFFEEKCEKQLIQPTFVYDYPIEISPLTKKKPEDPRLVERFELFINGMEFANAYSELNDPRDQRERFAEQLKRRDQGDDEANLPDEDYVEAMEYGLPPTGGMGIGIDRLTMLLTGAASIRDVLLFPTMKPLNDSRLKASAAPEPVSEPIDFSKVQIEPLFEDLVDFDTFIKSDLRAVKVLDCVAVPKSKKLLKFTLDDGSGRERIILSGIHAFYEPEELIGKTCLAILNLPPRAMMGIESCGMLLSAIHSEEGEEKLHLLMLDPHIPAGAKLS